MAERPKEPGEYYTYAVILGFLCLCTIGWFSRTSEPERVVDNWSVGEDSRGWYVEEEAHYEKQRGTVGSVLGVMAILGFGGGALYCIARAMDSAQKRGIQRLVDDEEQEERSAE